MNLPELRVQLAEAEIKLSHAKEDEKLARAQAEQRAIEAAEGNYGKNDSERGRFLTLALATDEDYQRVANWLRRCEQEAALLKAQVAGAEDQAQAERWEIRRQLAEALSVRYTLTDEGDEFDRAAQAELDDEGDQYYTNGSLSEYDVLLAMGDDPDNDDDPVRKLPRHVAVDDDWPF